MKDRIDDPTETQGFENASQNTIMINPGECPHCLRHIGESGRSSGLVNVITAKGPDQWCQDCYNKGVVEGICEKAIKLSKKERRKLKKLKRLGGDKS